MPGGGESASVRRQRRRDRRVPPPTRPATPTGPRRRPRRARRALLAFGVVLHRNGWRIIYLGADTPLADLVHTVAEKRRDVVILAAVTPERFREAIPDLITLARTAPLRLAGSGATTSIADTVGATILAGDPITEAQRLTPLS